MKRRAPRAKGEFEPPKAGQLDLDRMPGQQRLFAEGESEPEPKPNQTPVKAPGFAATAIGPLRKQAGQFIASLRGKSFPNEDTGIPIQIDRQGVREPVSGQRRAVELNALSALPEMLRTSRHYAQAPDNKGRPDIKAWHYYKVQVEIGGQVHEVTLVARELKDGRRFYDSYIMENEKPATKSGAASKTLGDPQAASQEKPTSTGGDVKPAAAVANGGRKS